MRQVVLDTETTGLEASQGHRVIEIGCVELIDRRPTGRSFHQYLNPDREIDEGAFAVHGISLERLKNEPRFAEVYDSFREFIQDSELIIHNAPFDVGFLDAELARLGQSNTIKDYCRILDSLVLARSLHPGQKNNLDALCKRYGIDNSNRDLHGALLDARILADVFLAMTSGQVSLGFGDERAAKDQAAVVRKRRADSSLRVICASDDECVAHRKRLQEIEEASGRCLWRD